MMMQTQLSTIHEAAIDELRLGDAVLTENDKIIGRLPHCFASDIVSQPKVLFRKQVATVSFDEFASRLLQPEAYNDNKPISFDIVYERDAPQLVTVEPPRFTINRAERALRKIGDDRLAAQDIGFKALLTCFRALHTGKNVQIHSHAHLEPQMIKAIGVGIGGCAVGVMFVGMPNHWCDLREISLSFTDDSINQDPAKRVARKPLVTLRHLREVVIS